MTEHRHITDAPAARRASAEQQERIRQEQAASTARMEHAFERHYDTRWHDPTMRNERLAWIAAWRAASAQAHARYEYDRRSATP